MTTRIKVGLGGLLLTLTAIYFYYEDSLPPRTPRKVAILISGLSMPRGIKLEKTIDTWAPNGDGEVLIRGILTDQELSDLIEVARTSGFKNLPIDIFTGTANINDDLVERRNGFYKIDIDKDDPRDYNLTIIDMDKKELITYLSVM